jgi:ABC-type antimicrobial peptide transport system permease subunit
MQYYLALHANTLPGSTAQSLLVRIRGDAPAAVTTVRRAVTELGGPVRYVDVSLLEDRIRPQMRSWTLGAAMFTTFGLLALVVAAIGLYSVLAYGVAERMHELGVRAALGASRRRLVALVLRRGVQLVLAGVIIGVAIALAAAPKIQPLLFDTSPRDPLVLVSVAAVLLLVALLASVGPAWRATRVDPQQALRAE